jgi:hypothetical protein
MSLTIWQIATPQSDSPRSPGQVNFIGQYIDVEAIGLPPDRLAVGSASAYADAQRAAYILAERDLAGILSGLYIESSTSFQDAGAHEFVDKVKAELLRTHVPRGKVIEQTSPEDFKKTNQVRMTVRFQLSDSIPELMRTLGPHLRQVEKTLPVAVARRKTATSMTAYDGLIVKVPATFRPTISPKLYNSEGELVYGANSVALDVLMIQGGAQFTNSTSKAKAELKAHGAKNILTINGTLHPGDKDVDIEDSDAAIVLNANARSNLLQKGRVFIVVGSGM